MDFLMVIMASGIARGRERTTAAARDGVAEDRGQTPANRLAETCRLGL